MKTLGPQKSNAYLAQSIDIDKIIREEDGEGFDGEESSLQDMDFDGVAAIIVSPSSKNTKNT